MAKLKKKKKFLDVEIPIINKTTQLQAYEINDLQNKYLKYDLTRVLRGKNVLLQAKIKIEKEKAIAIPTKLTVLNSFLKRMTRKGTNHVEDSFSTKTKDSQVRIKPFLITRKKVSRAVRKALREKAKKELVNYLKTKNTNTIFDDILQNKLQKELSLKLKKIYPLSLCEIRILKVEKQIEEKPEKQK